MGDIDNVTFSVKQDEWYGVFTSNLALGVDTAVTTTVGSDTWYNDDYDPGGGLASTVCFSVTANGVATATITNLDQFGPTKSYSLTVVQQPFMEANPDSVTFTAVESGTIPAPQTINITVPGEGNLLWTASESIDWLDIGPTIDKTPSTMHLIITGTIGMSNGFYSGIVAIAPKDIAGAPCSGSLALLVPVNLVIAPAPLSSSVPESEAWFIPGVAYPTPRPQMIYERTGIFLPLYRKEWDSLRRFHP